jgi:hypothetical protein
MKPKYIQNPNSVERAAIEADIAAGYDVILQFDKPSYSPELLRRINNLCGELGKILEVRFYGHKFDAAISEIQHSFLEELEIIRVVGFCSFDSISALPSLRSLAIEDQLRLEKISFTAANQNIQSVRIFNCKTLRNLEGLNYLTNLKSIQIGMTAIEIDSVLQQRLPSSLKTFGFYTGKKKENAKARAKLDAIGYREHER